MKKTLLLLLSALIIIACGNNQQPLRVVSETPVKTNVLGVELCSKVTKDQVKTTLNNATEKTFYAVEDNLDYYKVITANPCFDSNFSFGTRFWHYARVYVDQKDLVYRIELTQTFESIDKAKEEYESVYALYTHKYGKGNEQHNDKGESLTFWTDDTNSVGVFYEESATIKGEDRSYCILYYVNRELADAVDAAMQPDI